MHLLAVILIASAGAAYCAAGWRGWRSLGAPEPEAAAEAKPSARAHPLLWAGFACHSLALAVALVMAGEPGLLDAILGAWAAVAAALFASSLRSGGLALLALPIGCAALLIAGAAIAGPTAPPKVVGAITILHAACMSAYVAAVLVAGSAGILYLAASRQLKSASARGFRMPALPTLDRLTERSLIATTALLMAGVATGGVALGRAGGAHLFDPTIATALVALGVLVLVHAARLAHRLGQRAQAGAAVVCLVLGAAEVVSLLVGSHG
jgi:hypothetical protein